MNSIENIKQFVQNNDVNEYSRSEWMESYNNFINEYKDNVYRYIETGVKNNELTDIECKYKDLIKRYRKLSVAKHFGEEIIIDKNSKISEYIDINKLQKCIDDIILLDNINILRDISLKKTKKIKCNEEYNKITKNNKILPFIVMILDKEKCCKIDYIEKKVKDHNIDVRNVIKTYNIFFNLREFSENIIIVSLSAQGNNYLRFLKTRDNEKVERDRVEEMIYQECINMLYALKKNQPYDFNILDRNRQYTLISKFKEVRGFRICNDLQYRTYINDSGKKDRYEQERFEKYNNKFTRKLEISPSR